jgi:hypothetical protein
MSEPDKFEEALRAFANVLRGDAAPAATPPTAQSAAAPAAPVAAPEIPAAPLVPAPVAAAAQAAGPQPPPGRAALQTIDEWEAFPEKEQLARMDEVDELLRQGAK